MYTGLKSPQLLNCSIYYYESDLIMIPKNSLLTVAWALVAMTVVGVAPGDVIFNNFTEVEGHQNSYNQASGSEIFFHIVPGEGVRYAEVAASFTVEGSSDYLLDSLTLPLFRRFDDATFTISLHSNGTRDLPGLVTYTEQRSDGLALADDSGDLLPPVTVHFADNPMLLAGETYWFSIETFGLSPSLIWNDSLLPDSTSSALRNNDSRNEWSPDFGSPAFRVEGTLVPSPSGLALVGLAGCLGASRRRYSGGCSL